MEDILQAQKVTNSRLLRTENKVKSLQVGVAKMFEALDFNLDSHIKSLENSIAKLDKSVQKGDKKIWTSMEKNFKSFGTIMDRIHKNLEVNTKLVDGLTEVANENLTEVVKNDAQNTSEEEMEATRREQKKIELLEQIARNTEPKAGASGVEGLDLSKIAALLSNFKMDLFKNFPQTFGTGKAQPPPAGNPKGKQVPVYIPPGSSPDPKNPPEAEQKPKGRIGRIVDIVKDKGGKVVGGLAKGAATVGRGVGSVVGGVGRGLGMGVRGLGAVAGVAGPIGGIYGAVSAINEVLKGGELSKENPDYGKVGAQVAGGIIEGLTMGLVSPEQTAKFLEQIRNSEIVQTFFDSVFSTIVPAFEKVGEIFKDLVKSFVSVWNSVADSQLGKKMGLGKIITEEMKAEEAKHKIEARVQGDKFRELGNAKNQIEIGDLNFGKMKHKLIMGRDQDVAEAKKQYEALTPEGKEVIARQLAGVRNAEKVIPAEMLAKYLPNKKNISDVAASPTAGQNLVTVVEKNTVIQGGNQTTQQNVNIGGGITPTTNTQAPKFQS